MKLLVKIIAVALVLTMGTTAFAAKAQTDHERAVESWKKKDYKEFKKHASNFLINYPKHDYRSNIDYRIGKAMAYLGEYKQAVEHLYKVAEKYRYSPHGLMARDDAKLIESAAETQKKALDAYFKADEIKIHITAQLKAKEHETLKDAFDKVSQMDELSGLLAARVAYEVAITETRELKREYTFNYPKIKAEMLIGIWDTFEAEHEGEPIAFKGFIQKLRIYAWLAEPFGRSQKNKPRISFFDRAIALAKEGLKGEKNEQNRRLLRYRLAKLLKEKQFALYVIDVTRSFRVLRETMEVYEDLLADSGDWYFAMDIVSDMVDLKCLVNQFDDAKRFAFDQEKNYKGEPEYGQVMWTLFKYMSQAQDKATLIEAIKVLQALNMRYGSTTFYLNGIEQYRNLRSIFDKNNVFPDEILGSDESDKNRPRATRAMAPKVGKPEKQAKKFLFTDSVGVFIGVGLGVVLLLAVLLFVAERLRYKEELLKAEQDQEDGRLE